MRPSPPLTLEVPIPSPGTYAGLRSAIKSVLVAGQNRLESLRVEIYWQTGGLMDRYLKAHSETNARRLTRSLGRDLGINPSVLYRLLQFFQAFPDFAAGRNLTWTHYRALLALPDEAKRLRLAGAADHGLWPVRRLEREILKERGERAGGPRHLRGMLEEPPRRRPGVRRIAWLEALGGKREKVVDLGFHTYRGLSAPEAARFQIGETVVWSPEKAAWAAGGTAEEVYVYEGGVERAVDGDTLLVHVDLGFGLKRRQYLRLRGIDAEPLSSPEGRRAFRFLLGILRKSPRVLFRSRFTDRYDRYLSDVWAGRIYLNQALLDRGLAKKV